MEVARQGVNSQDLRNFPSGSIGGEVGLLLCCVCLFSHMDCLLFARFIPAARKCCSEERKMFKVAVVRVSATVETLPISCVDNEVKLCLGDQVLTINPRG